jgi:hypothetical protein
MLAARRGPKRDHAAPFTTQTAQDMYVQFDFFLITFSFFSCLDSRQR